MRRNPFSRLTIRQRLPLLISLLLLSISLIFGFISYLGVRKAALKVGEERLQTLSLQLSTMLSGNVQGLITTTHVQANTPAVRSFLLSNGKDSAETVKKWLSQLLNDSNYVAACLLNSRRVRLIDSAKTDISNNLLPDNLFIYNAEQGNLGKLYANGKFVLYPVVVSVTNNERLLGYLVKWRRMLTKPGELNQLSNLLGTDAKLYFGNAEGSLWTDMMVPLEEPLYVGEDKNKVIHFSRAGEKQLASVHAIPNSPWVVSIEFPENKILQAAGTYLYWLLIAGSLLIIAGIFLAWLMSRNISAPLVQLTAATSKLAAGNYSSPVLVDRYDEVGKLARSFNAMCIQVKTSQEQLEKKAENYKLLFEENPMPMWIMCLSTQNILDVNGAAVEHYGYSKKEFLKLNSKDIRPQEDVPKFLEAIKAADVKYRRGIWRHKKVDGSMIMVDLLADTIVYNNEPAMLVLAHDVTEKLKAEAELIRNRVLQQQIITETTILAQEKEREEIGKELHDNINQILASTKLYLELARNGDKELLQQAISKSYENINLAIGEIRQLSKQLIKPSFDTSLCDALKDITEDLQAVAPIEISFISSAFDEENLDESIKLMIYRVVQEQLNNILKHAAASRVQISLRTDKENVYLAVRDNGIGFDMNKKSKGIGLRNIDNRVQFHKGIVSLHSKPGGGCAIEISVPLIAKQLTGAGI
jgi:PAS domain S-box-containing protein